jgi:beta-galactosidase/beta-glucuronidase
MPWVFLRALATRLHKERKMTDPLGGDESPRFGYPRPQLRRARWQSLDGEWVFALDPGAAWHTPADVTWNRKIRVPFSPETEASGIGDEGLYRACWYRRRFDAPAMEAGERLLLHFAAVDYHATVWINGAYATQHEGGYTPFHVDLTSFLRPGEPVEVVVRAEDDPHELAKPRGKQDWQLEPHSIWYPRTTGIWQSVWLEPVPATWITGVRWTTNLERWEVGFEAKLAGERRDFHMRVRLRVGELVLADDTYSVSHQEVHRRIALSDPGIDDSRNGLLWSPGSPTLIEAVLELHDESGTIIDRAESYTALRAIAVQGDRLVLNGRPFQLRMVLDQGYWPETGMTAPDDEAYRRDVELAKAMGFNGVRKHQKIESPRYLYWADVLGLLVWEEMPSAYRFTRESVDRVTRQWVDVLARDYSHPCIICWVPINESWGVPNLPDSAAERHYVRSLYHLTKTLDPTRPVIGNDGWESVATDLIGIHDYDATPSRIQTRYHADEVRPRLFRRERPGGRLLLVDQHPHSDLPIVLSEFGGIALHDHAGASWGYAVAPDGEGLARRYGELLRIVRSLEMLCGFCYTQFADTYQEANGLLRADRTPKFPLALIAEATQGPRADLDRDTTDPVLPPDVPEHAHD